jgi:L-malate glycosyltransferase
MMAYLCGFRPYAVYVVGSDVLFGGWGKRLLSRLALNAASKVLVNGQYLTKKTIELAPKAKAQCLYLGTDTIRFIPRCIPTQPVKIICTRGFSEVYNNEYIIHALEEMSTLAEAFHVIFAAPGPLLERVRAIADQVLPSRLRQSVEFLGGVGRDRMTELLRDAHIFVSVSRSDGTSLSLMEGLACGLFPVVSDIPANREWISVEAENGILVPLDEPKTLAAALAQAIRDPGLRAKAAIHNRELIVRLADDRRNMAILGNELEKIAHCTG